MSAKKSNDRRMAFNLVGRVRNLTLPPTPKNSLSPVFEAVSNSIHAIEANFGAKNLKQGRIVVAIERTEGEDGNPIAISIKDNGIGLNDDNFKSFVESDSDFKAKRGGKGIGRLLWLKAFQECQIESTFQKGANTKSLRFRFALNNEKTIRSLENISSANRSIGTEVKLNGLIAEYQVSIPKKTETLASKLVSHFLPYLISGNAPAIVLADQAKDLPINQLFLKRQVRKKSVRVRVEGEARYELQVTHLLLEKTLKFDEAGSNFIFFGANDRVVEELKIDNQIGLRTIHDQKDCVYVGYVSGGFLDSHVNQERTGFAIGGNEWEAIRRSVLESSKSFLKPFIDVVVGQQVETIRKLIEAHPQFINTAGEPEEFARKNLQLSSQSDEEIYVELSRHKLRSNKREERAFETAKKGDSLKDATEAAERYAEHVKREHSGFLAEYVRKRREILDILTDRLAHANESKDKYYREDVIHRIICPLKKSSDDLNYDDHALWVIDDRLSYYAYFKSDQSLKSSIADADNALRPDLAFFFRHGLAFRQDQTDGPVLLVEFKRPGRDNYNDADNPIAQIFAYIEELRSPTKAVKDRKGRVVTSVGPGSRFFAQIIADVTPTLKRLAGRSGFLQQTPDGRGYFGFNSDHKLYMEIIPYDKLLDDAFARNRIFFEKL